jgi:hypothetical protein
MGTTRSTIRSRSNAVRPFPTRAPAPPRTAPLPRSASAMSRSLSSTGVPASAVTCAMPDPIRPAPSTATRRTGFAASLQGFFLAAAWAKNTWISARASGVNSNSEKAAALASRPAARPRSAHTRSTSRMRFGAG